MAVAIMGEGGTGEGAEVRLESAEDLEQVQLPGAPSSSPPLRLPRRAAVAGGRKAGAACALALPERRDFGGAFGLWQWQRQQPWRVPIVEMETTAMPDAAVAETRWRRRQISIAAIGDSQRIGKS